MLLAAELTSMNQVYVKYQELEAKRRQQAWEETIRQRDERRIQTFHGDRDGYYIHRDNGGRVTLHESVNAAITGADVSDRFWCSWLSGGDETVSGDTGRCRCRPGS